METIAKNSVKNPEAVVKQLYASGLDAFYEDNNIIAVSSNIKGTVDNKIPFVTFLTPGENGEKATAHNIYFSEEARKLVKPGDKFDEDNFDNQFRFYYFHNETTDEKFITIGLVGNSVYRPVKRKR